MQRRLDKNPIFGIRPFLLLPRALSRSSQDKSRTRDVDEQRRRRIMDRWLRAFSCFEFDFHGEHRQHHQMDKPEIKSTLFVFMKYSVPVMSDPGVMSTNEGIALG